jgi:hypothetical protein
MGAAAFGCAVRTALHRPAGALASFQKQEQLVHGLIAIPSKNYSKLLFLLRTKLTFLQAAVRPRLGSGLRRVACKTARNRQPALPVFPCKFATL